MATQKAISMARRLADELTFRLNGDLDVVESRDSNGNPLVTVGDAGIGDAGCLIRIVTVPTIQKNSIGLDQEVFTPHIVQLMTEANYAGSDNGVADINTATQFATFLAVCVETGAKVEIWQTANGTAPSAGAFATGSNKKGEVLSSVQYPLMNQQ